MDRRNPRDETQPAALLCGVHKIVDFDDRWPPTAGKRVRLRGTLVRESVVGERYEAELEKLAARDQEGPEMM